MSIPSPSLGDLNLKPKEMLFVQHLASGESIGQAAVSAGYAKTYGSALGRKRIIREAMSRIRQSVAASQDDGELAALNLKRSLDLLTEIAERSTDDHARIKAIGKAMDLSGESPQNQIEDVARGIKTLMEGLTRARRPRISG